MFYINVKSIFKTNQNFEKLKSGSKIKINLASVFFSFSFCFAYAVLTQRAMLYYGQFSFTYLQGLTCFTPFARVLVKST